MELVETENDYLKRQLENEMKTEEFERADKLIDSGDAKAGFDMFLKAAEAGDVDGMARVSVMYSQGEGVPLNFDKSIYWDEKAIEGGSTLALGNLGITYRMKGDLRTAKFYFEKSLKSGNGGAALELAKLYLVSPKEIERVIDYLYIAIEHDSICEASEEEAEELLKELEG